MATKIYDWMHYETMKIKVMRLFSDFMEHRDNASCCLIYNARKRKIAASYFIKYMVANWTIFSARQNFRSVDEQLNKIFGIAKPLGAVFIYASFKWLICQCFFFRSRSICKYTLSGSATYALIFYSESLLIESSRCFWFPSSPSLRQFVLVFVFVKFSLFCQTYACMSKCGLWIMLNTE